MDTTEKEVIEPALTLLKKIIGIIRSEIYEIESKCSSKNQAEKEPIDEKIRTTILATEKSYLDFYKKIAEFLYSKIENNSPEEEFFFYLPLIRTQIEIYAHLSYLCHQDEKQKMILASVNILDTVARLGLEIMTPEIEESYAKIYLDFKDFFEREGKKIPNTATEYNKAWSGKKVCKYLHIEQMLKESDIKVSSPQITNLNINLAKNTYKSYRGLSNYVHGNILSRAHHGGEKFWVIGETLLHSIMIAEVISIQTLNNSKKKEIKCCVTDLEKLSYFRQAWSDKSAKIKDEQYKK